MDVTEKIWKDYHAKLLAFIVKRVDDPDTAEDILQDVFLKIHNKMESLRQDAKLESWLYQITRNAVVDFYRQRKPSVELPDWLSHSESDSAAQANTELQACLMPMMDQLPKHYRDALILSELQGKTQREVSIAQNISLSGAKSRIQRGRSLLQGMMFACCEFELDRNRKVMNFKQKNKCSDSC